MVAIVTELHTDEKVDATVEDVGFRETLPPMASNGGLLSHQILSANGYGFDSQVKHD